MFRCNYEANGWQPFATFVSLHRMITAERGAQTPDLGLSSRFLVQFFDFTGLNASIPAVEKQNVAVLDGI
jgi:hypothetical protein